MLRTAETEFAALQKWARNSNHMGQCFTGRILDTTSTLPAVSNFRVATRQYHFGLHGEYCLISSLLQVWTPDNIEYVFRTCNQDELRVYSVRCISGPFMYFEHTGYIPVPRYHFQNYWVHTPFTNSFYFEITGTDIVPVLITVSVVVLNNNTECEHLRTILLFGA